MSRNIANFLIKYNNLEIHKTTPTSIKDNVKKSIEEKIIKSWFRESEKLFLNLKPSDVNKYMTQLEKELKELEGVVSIIGIDARILQLYLKKKKEYNDIIIQYMTGNFKGIKKLSDIDWNWDVKKTGLVDGTLKEEFEGNVNKMLSLMISGGVAATQENLKKIASKKLKSDSEILFEYDLQQLAIFYNNVLNGIVESYSKITLESADKVKKIFRDKEWERIDKKYKEKESEEKEWLEKEKNLIVDEE